MYCRLIASRVLELKVRIIGMNEREEITMRVIESADNPLFKKFHSLKSPHQSKKEKLILIEGSRHVADLMNDNIEPEYLVFPKSSRGEMTMKKLEYETRDSISNLSSDKMLWLAPHLFERLSAMKTPQGVLAVFSPSTVSLAEMIATAGKSVLESMKEQKNLCGQGPSDSKKKTLKHKKKHDPAIDQVTDEGLNEDTVPLQVLVLEDVQDPGNVGTLIRTADALGFHGVIMTESTATIFNPKTVAASMGSIFHLPIVQLDTSIENVAKDLKKEGFVLVATALRGESLGQGRPQARRLAVILGNEGNGLSDAALSSADITVMIPMKGKAESLNVASAGAILMWEIVRGQCREE